MPRRPQVAQTHATNAKGLSSPWGGPKGKSGKKHAGRREGAEGASNRQGMGRGGGGEGRAPSPRRGAQPSLVSKQT